MADDPDSAHALIIDAARQRIPDISRQTVYDALNALTAAGLIRRINPRALLA